MEASTTNWSQHRGTLSHFEIEPEENLDQVPRHQNKGDANAPLNVLDWRSSWKCHSHDTKHLFLAMSRCDVSNHSSSYRHYDLCKLVEHQQRGQEIVSVLHEVRLPHAFVLLPHQPTRTSCRFFFKGVAVTLSLVTSLLLLESWSEMGSIKNVRRKLRLFCWLGALSDNVRWDSCFSRRRCILALASRGDVQLSRKQRESSPPLANRAETR